MNIKELLKYRGELLENSADENEFISPNSVLDYVLPSLVETKLIESSEINSTSVGLNYENGNKLLKKKVFINITDIDDIINYDLTKSIICNCVINNKEYNKLKYSSILYEIYNLINDGTKIIIYTLLNIKTIKNQMINYF